MINVIRKTQNFEDTFRAPFRGVLRKVFKIVNGCRYRTFSDKIVETIRLKTIPQIF